MYQLTLTILTLLCATVYTLNPVTVRNNKLYDSVTGQRFYVKGIGYGYDMSDKYEANWKPAVDLIKQTIPDINAIRFYTAKNTDNSTYHKVSQYTQQLGIYLIVPITVTQPTECALNRIGLPSLTADQTCYPSCLLSEALQLINKFNYFNNTLAYVVGNEVINNRATWAAAPCVKSFIRDIKTYTKQCNLRSVPLLYTNADDALMDGIQPEYSAEKNNRLKLDYLTCGNVDEQLDLFGLNTFRYCTNHDNFTTSNMYKLQNAFEGSTIPVLFTEYGCAPFYDAQSNKPIQRTWDETPVIYGTTDGHTEYWNRELSKYSNLTIAMNSLFSGGVAYEYGSRGGNDYALFTGGSKSEYGTVGTQKSCDTNHVCSVDLYAQQLHGVSKYLDTLDELQLNKVDDNTGYRPCMDSPFKGIDLTIADSRLNADGYQHVDCPIYDKNGYDISADIASGKKSAPDSTASASSDSSDTTSDTDSDTTPSNSNTDGTNAHTNDNSASTSKHSVDKPAPNTQSNNNNASSEAADLSTILSAILVPLVLAIVVMIMFE